MDHVPSRTTDDASVPDGSAFDAVVLGAGISGLVSASLLAEHSGGSVLVVDEYAHVGGNHIDRTYGGYTFDIGSLVFQDDSPLLRHFPEILPRYVRIDPSWGRLNPQGMVTRYPFSVRDDFLAAGVVECVRLLLSVAFARVARRRMHNARDFAVFWIGARLLRRSGLEKYMERFYGLPADQIGLALARKRMLWISEHGSVRNQLRRLVTRRRARFPEPPANHQLARPHSGFADLYRPAVDRLTACGVSFQLGSRPTALHRCDRGFALEVAGRRVVTKRVVSTIPIARIRDLCGIAPGPPLPTVTLISLFFSFSGKRGFRDPILYNFAHDGCWKRLTVYSDFYGPSGGREYFGVEVVGGPLADSVESAEHDFRSHACANGLFAGDLRLEGSHVLTEAYPIYADGADEEARRTIAALRAFGVESFGRQGGFQYQPTARVSTLEAEAALADRGSS